MKKWTLGLLLVLAFALASLAQTSSTGSKSGSSTGQSSQMGDQNMGTAAAGTSTSVTGCLNGSAGNYTLTNGKYKNGVAVTAASGVDLAPHIGHEVRLTGTWEKGSGSAAAGGTTASKTFNATSMKHISETCSMGSGKSDMKGKSGMSDSSNNPPPK